MKRCPWCRAYLSVGQLFFLEREPPSQCKACRKLFRNSLLWDIVSFFLPVLISSLVALFLGLPPAFWIVLWLVTYLLSHMLLAQPVKAQYKEEHPCLRCGRLRAGYRRAYDSICDACLTKEEAMKKRAR
jgi:hypothetical protein